MANTYRSSGLDFSDGKLVGPIATMAQHPDLADNKTLTSQPSHLQRNKTERRRLQGLQRTFTNTSVAKVAPEERGWRQRLDVWMINEGGKQLFFGTWIFLHLLVAVFGFMHYQLKDNAEGARAVFGITFRESLVPLLSVTACLLY